MNEKRIIRNRAKDFLNKFREYEVESKIFDFTPELQETLSHLKSKGYLDYTTRDVFGVQKIVHVKLTDKGIRKTRKPHKGIIAQSLYRDYVKPVILTVIAGLILAWITWLIW